MEPILSLPLVPYCHSFSIMRIIGKSANKSYLPLLLERGEPVERTEGAGRQILACPTGIDNLHPADISSQAPIGEGGVTLVEI